MATSNRTKVKYYDPETEQDVEGTLTVRGLKVQFTWHDGHVSNGRDAGGWVAWADSRMEEDVSLQDIIESYLS